MNSSVLISESHGKYLGPRKHILRKFPYYLMLATVKTSRTAMATMPSRIYVIISSCSCFFCFSYVRCILPVQKVFYIMANVKAYIYIYIYMIFLLPGN